MADFDRILSVKNAIEAKLRRYPGVHAVGIGHKITGEKHTGEMSITVFVTQKRALSDLQAHEVIPTEIEGIKTDVVEREIPHLLMAGDPTALTNTAILPGLTLTFSGSVSSGLVVVVEFSLTPPGATFLVSTETADRWQLANVASTIASAIAEKLTILGQSWLTATPSGAQVTLEPTGGGTGGGAASITRCWVIAVDDTKYFNDFVRGGIQIQAGGSAREGTLGWLASSEDASTSEHFLFGVTCHHVVALWTGQPSNLKVSYNSTTHLLSFSQVSATVPIPPETLVVIEFRDHLDPAFTDFNAIYPTVAGDTPATIAAAVLNVIVGLGPQGSVQISASAGPDPTTIQVTAKKLTLTFQINAHVSGPPESDPNSALKAWVVRDKDIATRHVVTFTGRVDGDDYGIYVNIDLGGAANTFNVFLNPYKKKDLTAIAFDVAEAINGVAASIRGPVSASHSGADVTVDGAALLQCLVTSDIRVGQPIKDFTCACSHCCNKRIGRIAAVDLLTDTALISIDSDLKYAGAVEDETQAYQLELLVGSYAVSEADLPTQPGSYPVHKRGRTTRRTNGTIQYLNVSGDILSPGGLDRLFHRHYKNAMYIHSSSNDPFALGGDSGSAVLNDNHEVVGILFGGGELSAYATPVEQILAAYPSFNLKVAVPVPAGNTTPVPVPASAHAMAQDRRIFQRSAPAPTGLATFEKRLIHAEEEISAIPEGREYSLAIRRHVKEAVRLVNHNRRVAAVWHRNGGPQIIGGILGMVQYRDRPLPAQVNGKPLAECLARIQDVFARYGSEPFAADLQKYGPRFFELLGQTYNQMLSDLQLASTRRGSEHGG